MTIDTGGPAFPTSIRDQSDGKDVIFQFGGMTLLDYFAASALQGLLAGSLADGSVLGEDAETIYPAKSYELARAMIAERAK